MRHAVFGRVALVLVFSMLVAVPFAYAQKRVALVIGNGAYAKVGKLQNPSSDANAMAALLKAAGFDRVTVQQDLGAAAMRRILRDFSNQVRDADIAVLFYAGHGMEVNGSNYLIPVDAVLERDIDVEDETVSLDRVTQILEQAKRLRLVILDACRDNPFLRSMKRTASTRSIGRGLAKVEILTSDTLIAFAAKAGSTAADGDGTNSPYTTALVKHLTTPGLDLRLALGRVRDNVLQSTRNRQEPFFYGSLGGAEIALVSAATSSIETRIAQPEPPKTTGIIVKHDAASLAKVISERRFIVPEFDFEKSTDSTLVAHDQFVGVWTSKVGFNGGTGRQAILVITKIVGPNKANGIFGWGPPTGKSYDQVPAGSTSFLGAISGGSVVFNFGSKIQVQNRASRDADNRMHLTQTRSDGNSATITLEPIWTLSGGTRSSTR